MVQLCASFFDQCVVVNAPKHTFTWICGLLKANLVRCAQSYANLRRILQCHVPYYNSLHGRQVHIYVQTEVCLKNLNLFTSSVRQDALSRINFVSTSTAHIH